MSVLAFRSLGTASTRPIGKMRADPRDRPGATVKLTQIRTIGKSAREALLTRDYPVTLAFSPDGDLLAAGGLYGRIRLLKTRNWQTVYDLPSQKDDIQALAFSGDGKVLVSASEDGVVALWEVATGQMRARFRSTPWVKAVAISPDGRFLAIGGRFKPEGVGGGARRLWLRDLLADRQLPTPEEFAEPVVALRFSPNGKILAAGADRGRIAFIEPPTGKVSRWLQTDAVRVGSLVFDPAGAMLVSLGLSSSIQFWDVATGQQRMSLAVPLHLDGLSMSGCGRYLAGGSTLTGLTWVWDLKAEKGRPATTTFPRNGGDLLFSPKERVLVITNSQKGLRVLEVSERK